MVDKSWPLASCNFWKRLICLVQDPDTVNLTCAQWLSAVLRWSAGRKSFSAKTVVFRRKKSISSCRLASFSYCQLSLLFSSRFHWLEVATERLELSAHAIGSVPTQQNRKRVPRCLDLSPTWKINVKNSDSSHRLALSVEHSRVFRFQGDSLLKSLYLLWERKRDNKT